MSGADIDLQVNDIRDAFKQRAFDFWEQSQNYRDYGQNEQFNDCQFRSRLPDMLAPIQVDGALKLLDLACGSGDNLPYLPAGIDYVGIDCSPVGIERLLERQDHAELTKQGVVGDVETIDLPDESQDAVLGTYCFEHFLNIPRILSECDRVLRPGGRIIIVGPDYDNLNTFAPPQFDGLLGNRVSHMKYVAGRAVRRLRHGSTDGRVLFEYVEPSPLCDETYVPDRDLTHLTSHRMISRFLQALGYECVDLSYSHECSGSSLKQALTRWGIWGDMRDGFLVMQKNDSSQSRRKIVVEERLVWLQD